MLIFPIRSPTRCIASMKTLLIRGKVLKEKLWKIKEELNTQKYYLLFCLYYRQYLFPFVKRFTLVHNK